MPCPTARRESIKLQLYTGAELQEETSSIQSQVDEYHQQYLNSMDKDRPFCMVWRPWVIKLSLSSFL